jgi:hypothetical protein
MTKNVTLAISVLRIDAENIYRTTIVVESGKARPAETGPTLDNLLFRQMGL